MEDQGMMVMKTIRCGFMARWGRDGGDGHGGGGGDTGVDARL